jgi:ketosteroid isomerase-like protein
VGRALALVDPKVQLFATRTGAETGQPYHLYLGHEGVREYFEQVALVWQDLRFETRECRETDDAVVALGTRKTRRHRGQASGRETAWALRFRDEVIAWARAYDDPAEALRDVPMPNIELVVSNNEALRRRDFAAARVAPELEFRAPVTAAALGESKVYHGRDGLVECFADVDRVWEEVDVEIDHYRQAGDHVLAVGRLQGLMRDGTEVDVTAHWAWRVEDGRVVWTCEYTDVNDALRAVGLNAS